MVVLESLHSPLCCLAPERLNAASSSLVRQSRLGFPSAPSSRPQTDVAGTDSLGGVGGANVDSVFFVFIVATTLSSQT